MKSRITPLAICLIAGGFCLSLAIIFLDIVARQERISANQIVSLITAVVVVTGVAAVLSRYYQSRKISRHLLIETDSLSIPIGFSLKNNFTKSPNSLIAVITGGQSGRHLLQLNFDDSGFQAVVSQNSFEKPDDFLRFYRNLLAIVQKNKGLSALNSRTIKNVRKSKPHLSLTLISGLIFIFLMQLAIGPGRNGDPIPLIAMGSNSPDLVFQGEWYRLINANFLHANALHLMGNLGLLYLICVNLEKLIGALKLVIVLAIGMVAGSLTSAWLSESVTSLGASTIVFTGLGAEIGLHYQHRDRAFREVLIPLPVCATFIALSLAIEYFLVDSIAPVIDHSAHLGSLLTGFLLVALLPERAVTGRESLIGTVLMACLVVTVVASMLGSLERWQNRQPAIGYLSLLGKQLIERNGSWRLKNELAWAIAERDNVETATLSLATDLAQSAVLENSGYRVLDTLAFTYHRRAMNTQAYSIQQTALQDPEFLKLPELSKQDFRIRLELYRHLAE